MLIEIWESFCRAIIRFFDNRFNQDDRYEELRHLLEIERVEKSKLLNHILTPPTNKEEEIDLSDYKPIDKHIPFSVRRAALEKEDREKKQQQVDGFEVAK